MKKLRYLIILLVFASGCGASQSEKASSGSKSSDKSIGKLNEQCERDILMSHMQMAVNDPELEKRLLRGSSGMITTLAELYSTAINEDYALAQAHSNVVQARKVRAEIESNGNQIAQKITNWNKESLVYYAQGNISVSLAGSGFISGKYNYETEGFDVSISKLALRLKPTDKEIADDYFRMRNVADMEVVFDEKIFIPFTASEADKLFADANNQKVCFRLEFDIAEKPDHVRGAYVTSTGNVKKIEVFTIKTNGRSIYEQFIERELVTWEL